MQRTPQRFATYRGDVTHMVRSDENGNTRHEVVGPNTLGEFMTAMTTEHNPDINATRVGFAFATPEELGR